MNTQGAIEFLKKGGTLRGYVPRYEPGGVMKLVHWTESVMRGDKFHTDPEPMPKHVVDKLMDVPAMPRRTPQQRVDPLIRNLIDQAQKSKAAFGYVVWPKSIADQIKEVGWKHGDPTLFKRTEKADVDAITTYARWLMGVGSTKQRAKDRKKVTLDWHGHY